MSKLNRVGALAVAFLLAFAWIAQGAELEPLSIAERGEFRFVPQAHEKEVPERFRLTEKAFKYESNVLPFSAKTRSVTEVRFPSPITTEHECNNTVHTELYLPQGKSRRDGKMPGVVVLHILGGDFSLSRLFCNALANEGVAALFVKLPYYGPRRPPNSSRRMISEDPKETLEGMTQAIADIRTATAFLASHDFIDADRLGIFGISLGGITGSLALAIDPQISSGCLMLAGGDLGTIAWESKELDKVRKKWLEKGGTQQEFLSILSDIDPVKYGQRVSGKKILMLNATEDEVIPKACTESLWQSFGKPEIVWYNGGHYSVIRHLPAAIVSVQRFFR